MRKQAPVSSIDRSAIGLDTRLRLRISARPTTVQRLVKTARAMGLIVNGIEVGRDVIKVLVAEPDAPLLASSSAVSAAALNGNAARLARDTATDASRKRAEVAQ
jgi:hypothetical protein